MAFIPVVAACAMAGISKTLASGACARAIHRRTMLAHLCHGPSWPAVPFLCLPVAAASRPLPAASLTTTTGTKPLTRVWMLPLPQTPQLTSIAAPLMNHRGAGATRSSGTRIPHQSLRTSSAAAASSGYGWDDGGDEDHADPGSAAAARDSGFKSEWP